MDAICVINDRASGSHEVVVGLFFSFEAGFFTVLIAVVAAHDVIDHGGVVVRLVVGLAAASLQGRFLLLLVLAISGFFFLLGQFFLLDRKVVDDLLDLLGVTVLGKFPAQLAEEVLNAVGCRTGVEHFGGFYTEVLVVLFGVELDWSRLVIHAAEELIGEAFLGLHLEDHSLSAFAHTSLVLGFLGGLLRDAGERSLSLLELLLVVHLVGLFGAFVFFEIFRAFLSLLLGQLLFLLLSIDLVFVVKVGFGLLGLFFLLFLRLLVFRVNVLFYNGQHAILTPVVFARAHARLVFVFFKRLSV